VRDLLDSLYRGYPSDAILLWETDKTVPLQDFAVSQNTNPYQGTRLLLDDQQPLRSGGVRGASSMSEAGVVNRASCPSGLRRV